MEKYIGVKQIQATPMLCGEYFNSTSRDAPKGMGAQDDGYKVQYSDGYTSWSPKGVFEEAYRLTNGLTFGLAVEAMKLGHKVCREGWNGKGMFAYYVPAGVYLAHSEAMMGEFENDMVPYRHYLALKTAQDDVATWSPSTSDALAEDWIILE